VDGVLTLQINGKTDASTGSDMATQFGLGHFPMLLQPQPPAGSQPAGGSGITCLVIGLGSGVTVGAILSHEVERVDAVEIERGVAEAAELFASANRKALRDPRTRLILDDARNWLLCGRERYDVITSEPSNLWITGVSNLFTIEHYRLCKRRLSPDGVMCQWLHCYQMSEADFKTAIRTFRAAFEHVAVVPASLGDMLMLGTSQPLTPQTLDGLFGRVKACPDFQLIQLDTYADLLRKYTMLTEDVDRYVGPGPLNSDDNALLEFSAPRSLYTSWGAENLFGFLCRR
ncbi:MAG: hypothetical protein FJ272_05510, partial [Planctomycetes bacterium]|nr:hypothetical protein [Planctomycetota bacterium]